ncbi:MAG TPA: hypothetical protein VGV92_04500 [Gammaproteobacteria bacterium]|nr:hypothetical protein [Gammaproteobacteria bacterium]
MTTENNHVIPPETERGPVSTLEWERMVNSRTPLFVDGAKIEPQADFLNAFRQKLKGKNNSVPDNVVTYLIEGGAQNGIFGWSGVYKLIDLAAEQSVALEITRDNKQSDEDTVYEITTKGNALFLTMTVKNINQFHNTPMHFVPTEILTLDEGVSVGVKTTFKISQGKDGQAKYECISHKDTFLANLYEIYKTNTAHVVEIKNNQTIAEKKLAYLKEVVNFIDHNRLLVDDEFKANLNILCNLLRPQIPNTIKWVEEKLNPGFFTRLARRLFPNKEITIPPALENTPTQKSSSLSRMAKLFRRKEGQQPTTPRPTLRMRWKAYVEKRRAKNNLKHKRAEEKIVSSVPQSPLVASNADAPSGVMPYTH